MRLGYGVREFAEEGGVSMETQRAFESDKALPNADYYNKITKLGAETFWIQSGSAEDDALREKQPLPYTPEIRKMIDDFKDAEPSIQDAAKDMLKKSAEKKRGRIADSKKKT
jgi:transcriptional regulator with XRE-family HTH domain